MILSEQLTTGQVTFILRVAIQLLAYGGVFLIGLIVLSSAPRVASIRTHDILNRVVGKSTVTFASAKWMINYARGRSGDPIMPTRLLISIGLLILYTAFVSISDIGYLGLYACETSGGHYLDYPASVKTNANASAAIALNLVNGTDPSTVKAYRCDSVEVVSFGPNVTERNCTAWQNGTYADPIYFSHLNTTDSDVLMQRQLKHINTSRSAFIDLNTYYVGPGPQRVENPTVTNGLVINPHPTGVQMVIGVPQLSSQQQVTLNQTIALEVEFGCMTVGIYSQHDPDASGSGLDIYATNGTWRRYYGPPYLEDALSTAADSVRAYWLPLFNTSTLADDGTMIGYNQSNSILSTTANIQTVYLPTRAGLDNVQLTEYILGNCTETVIKRLNATIIDAEDAVYNACSMPALGGSVTSEGDILEGLSIMVCAASTQVNMVSAVVDVDTEGSVTLNITRLPADLNYVRASYWDAMEIGGNITQFSDFLPIERYTFSPNPAGPTVHYIGQYDGFPNIRSTGPGSGAGLFSRVAETVLDVPDALSGFAGLTLLNDGNNALNFTADVITRWAGQVGGSVILTSTAFNGWAALAMPPVTVTSTGGKLVSCYKPRFAFAFLPLVLATLVVLLWIIFLVSTSSLSGSGKVEELYGGVNPYVAAMRHDMGPASSTKETLLAWSAKDTGDPTKEQVPRLEIFDDWETNPRRTITQTALKYFKEPSAS
jgi:hypothetical protein